MSTPRVPPRVRLLSWFVAASVVLFVAATASATVWQGGDGGRPVSELALGQGGGWVTASFFVVGAGLMALAWGIHDTLRPGRGQRRATRLLVAAGLQVLGLGVFQTDTTIVPTTPHGWVHFALAAVAFVQLAVSFLLYARLFRSEPLWQPVRRGANALAWMAAGVFGVHLMPVIGPPAAAPYEGVLERLLIATMLLWVVLSSNHLRRLAQKTPSRKGTAATTEARAAASQTETGMRLPSATQA